MYKPRCVFTDHFIKFLRPLVILLAFCFSVFYCFGHSVQVQYCISCDGDLRLWFEHWHGSESISSTTMTLNIEYNGTTTSTIASPAGAVYGTTVNNLPGCQSGLIHVASCPNEANTYNDWVYYDFINLPTGVPITFTVVSGNTVFTNDACGMYPVETTFTISYLGGAVTDFVFCGNALTQPISINGSWTNSNTQIGLPASGVNDIPSFIPVSGETTTISVVNACSSYSFEITTSNPIVDAGQDQVLCDGDNTILTATGVGLTWDNGVLDNVPFQPPIGVTTYTVTSTDSLGCQNTDQLDVLIHSLPIVGALPNQVLCSGTATITTIVFTSQVAGTTYAWSNNNPSIGLASNGTGDIASFVASNVGTYSDTAVISVTPTANGCVGPDLSFMFIVNPIPTVDPLLDEVLCHNTSTAAVLFSNSVVSTTYGWTNSSSNIGLPASGSGDIASFTALNPGISPETGTIVVTPSALGCVGTTDSLTITVNPIPVVDPVIDQTLCNTILTQPVVFSGPVIGTIFDWTNTIFSIGLASNGTGDITSFVASNVGTSSDTAVISVTPTANGCVGPDLSFMFIVNPTPAVDPLLDQVLCHNTSTAAVLFSNSVVSTTYGWTNSSSSIGLPASGSGDIASFTALNPGISPETGTIVVTPSALGCVGTTDSLTITVNPIPVVDPVIDQTLCNTILTQPVVFSGPVIGTIFDWTNTISSIGLASNGTGDIASFIASNVGVYSDTAVISVVPTVHGCVGPDLSFMFIVNPTPIVDSLLDQVLCHNTSIAAVQFSSPVFGTTYTWINSNVSIGLSASGSGDIASFTALNPGTSLETGTIAVTPLALGCIGITDSLAITVNPLPEVIISGDTVVCDGETVTLSGIGPNTYMFTWNNGIADDTPFTPSLGLTTYTMIVVDSNTCVDSGFVSVLVNPLPIPSFWASDPTCEPWEVALISTSVGDIVLNIWEIAGVEIASASDSLNYIFSAAGLYDVSLISVNGFGCTDTIVYQDYISIVETPVAQFIPSSLEVNSINPEVSFENTSVYYLDFIWGFGDGVVNTSDVSPIHIFPDFNGGYYDVELVVENSVGCTDTAAINIRVIEELIFYVPNAFTPDDDDFNQTFNPIFSYGYEANDFRLSIYNRWGEIIFESYDPSIGWDGTNNNEIVQDGVYTWKIECGLAKNSERKKFYGHVNVLR